MDSPNDALPLYAQLISSFDASAGEPPECRWLWLEAAHVVGQMRLRLHWDSHVVMLRFAASQRDWREAAGQLFRLALVPLGHAIGRLPAGNIGRVTVSAFRPMAVPAALRERIAVARRHLAAESPRGAG